MAGCGASTIFARLSILFRLLLTAPLLRLLRGGVSPWRAYRFRLSVHSHILDQELRLLFQLKLAICGVGKPDAPLTRQSFLEGNPRARLISRVRVTTVVL